jgi:hypothetical protein
VHWGGKEKKIKEKEGERFGKIPKLQNPKKLKGMFIKLIKKGFYKRSSR